MDYKNKNILFSCCILDPWLDVAKEISQTGFTPKYWIGWKSEDLSRIKKEFPNIIIQEIEDAWRGNFNSLSDSDSEAELDGNILKSIAHEELLAIKMMERLDWDQKSFSFNERQEFFRHLLRSFLTILKKNEIELVVSPSIPHRVFDYALYLAADILKIKFLTFKMTVWPSRLLPVFEITKIPLVTNKFFEEQEQVLSYVKKNKGNYDIAEPYYMKNQKKRGVLFKIQNKLLKGNILKNILFFLKKSNSYTKNKKQHISKNNNRNYHEALIKLKGVLYKNKLKKQYQLLCDEVDYKEEFVFVALHYQPEETSCPSGGIYVNQELFIEALLKRLPKHVKIYVKEHSSQFNSLMEGETGRSVQFYQTLKKFDNVKLISTSINSFELIDASLAVATLTGTVGLEAVIRNKPVIVFGYPWYKTISGVFDCSTNLPLNLYDSLINFNKSTEEKLLTDLNIIYSNTIEVYVYKGYKEISGVTKETAVTNLISLIKNV